MEAIGDQRAEFGGSAAVLPRPAPQPRRRFEAYDDGTRPGLPARLPVASAASPASGLVDPDLAEIGGLLASFAVAAPELLASADYVEASGFAARVEEISRTVEYLQVLAAGTVDRTRTQAITAAATARASAARSRHGWTTGPNPDSTQPHTRALSETDQDWPAPTDPDRPVLTSPADDGCRTTAEFLRLRLHITIREATRRLTLAHQTLPGTTLTGEPTPPTRPHLATALTPTTGTTGTTGTSDNDPHDHCPAVSSHAATIITATLDRLQHHTTPETLDLIEHNLTTTAATSDPDFLTRIARRWADTINADGTEPTEEALRHTQGAFIRKPRHGLHHIEIFATPAQYEHLATAMNAATNPRTTPSSVHTTNSTTTGSETDTGRLPDLERRTRAQQQLDGILAALTAGLTTNELPATGGNRPQILATINYQDLFPTPGTTTPTGTGTFAFTGPIAATTLRKLACDADIIPALLGTHSEILDLGRKTRLFTPAQRLALTARDQGCAFPNCTAPAPWCEAHHITYWSHGGNTSTDNGVLLCNHHHHLIHKEQWTITTHHGTPTFIPPPHIDPTQTPQQNHYFKPPPPPHPRE